MSWSKLPKFNSAAVRAAAPRRFAFRHRAANSRLVAMRVASPLSDISAESRSWVGEVGSHSSPAALNAVGDEYFTEADSRPVILFDGVCNMCNAGVNMVLDWDSQGLYRFAALQSEAGKKLLQRVGRRPDDISSIVLVSKEGGLIKSLAVMKIAEGLDMPLPLLGHASHLVPTLVRDVVYDWVAANRYKIMGERDACRLMQPEWRDRFLV